MTTTIVNAGNIPLGITDLRFVSGGSDFTARFPTRSGASVAIPPGDSVRLDIQCVPHVPGRFLADTIRVICDSSAIVPSPSIDLLGRSELVRMAVTPKAIEFPDIDPFATRDTIVTVANTGTIPISWSPPVDAGRFSVVSVTPAVTPAGGLSTAVVRFHGNGVPGLYRADVPFNAGYCDITEWVRLSARVRNPNTTDDTVRGVILPGAIHGSPGTVVSIPILFRSDSKPDSMTGFSISGHLRFNRTLLLPLGSTPSGDLVGNERVIPFLLPVADKRGDTLGTFAVLALLGNQASTPLTLDSIDVGGVPQSITPEAGTFTLDGFCATGSSRLVGSGEEVMLRIVRVAAGVRIEFRPDEDGPCHIMAVDPLGNILAERRIAGETGREGIVEFLDPLLARFPLFVVLVTPSRAHVGH